MPLPWKRWSTRELSEFKRLVSLGKSFRQISGDIGRSYQSVKATARRYGIRGVVVSERFDENCRLILPAVTKGEPAYEVAKRLKCSPQTVYNVIRFGIEAGVLERVRHGKYREPVDL